MREAAGKGAMEPGFEMMLKVSLGADIVDYANELGPDNRMLLATARPDKVYDLQPMKLEDIVRQWFMKTPVPVILLNGFMGSGKTDFAFSIFQAVKDMGYTLVTNCEIKEDDGFCVNDTEELKSLLERVGGHKLFINDEAGAEGGARRSGSNLNVEINAIVTLARKRKTAVVYITQLERQADIVLRDLGNVLIEKRNPKKVHVKEIFNETITTYTLVNTPETNVYYDSYSIAKLISQKK